MDRWIRAQACLYTLTLVLTAACVALFALQAGGAEAATFSPDFGFKYCNALTSDFPSSSSTDTDLAGDPACIDTPISTNSRRDMTSTLAIPGGDANMGSFFSLNIPGSVSIDSSIPDGEKIGGIRADLTVSVLGGACIVPEVREFVLYEAETTGATVDPASEITADRFSNLQFDADGDGFADSNSPAIVSNVSIYEDLFTPANGTYIPPSARYSALTKGGISGTWDIISVFFFTAGALDAFAADPDDEPHQFGRISHAPTSGNVAITVVGDPTASETAPSPVQEHCSPTTMTTMLLGTTPGGHGRYSTVLSGGTHGHSAFTFGQRDADGDGVANDNDACPFTAGSVDSDLDGIPDACDPTPATNTGSGDHDGDGYGNRQDNCPLIANPGQADSEIDEPWISTAPDGGPKADGIGDVCDPSPTTGYTEGSFTSSYGMVPRCIGGTDADGDGYCAPHDLNDSNSLVDGFTLNLGMDVEYPGHSGGHGDHYGGNLELYVGTDPVLCTDPLNPPVSGSPSIFWPADTAGGGTINIGDILAFKPYFGGYDRRFDLAPSKTINIADILAVKPVFGKSC